MMPSKSMPEKSNHHFKEKYYYIHVGTIVYMRMKVIQTKDSCFQSWQNMKKTHNDRKFSEEVKINKVGDK